MRDKKNYPLPSKEKTRLLKVPESLRSITLFCLLSMLSISNAFTQQQAVSGVVVDKATNEPLIGVSILVVGTNNGTITDLDGRFLVKAAPDAVLRLSYIGYKVTDIPVKNQKEITIALVEDAKILDEVVVVGFGTQKKVNLTGSVGTASAKDIESRPVINVAQALQGVVPGLQITQKSGSMEKTADMNIRGTGTIGEGSSSAPLVLIDGMEGDMNTINPQDIENISVLKDAAAASIYGSRAPFGVILITTKSGKAGRTTINYNNNFRWGKPIVKMQMVDAYTFMNYYNQAERNTSADRSTTNIFTEETIENIGKFKRGEIDGPLPYPTSGVQWPSDYTKTAYADVSWYDIVFKDFNFSQEHNFSVNGGSEKVNYYFSVNYMGQEGLIKLGEEKLNRYNVSGKINIKLADWAKLNYSTRFTRADYIKPSELNDGLYENLGRQNWPNIPLYDNNGNPLGGRPGRDILMGGTYNQVKDILYQQFALELEPIKAWITTAEFNYRINSHDIESIHKKCYDHDINGEPLLYDKAESRIYENRYKSNHMNVNLYSKYNFTLNGNHNFSALLGGQLEEFKEPLKYNLTGYGLLFEDVPVLGLINHMKGTEEYGPFVGGTRGSWSTAGIFGRLNYDYSGRYLFEANLRYDGTSRFRSDRRWAWFPSFSAGWNIAQESFWEPYKKMVNTLKLRASYGELGNTNTSEWYPTYLTLDVKNNNGLWIQDGKKPTTTNTPNPISQSLTWETVRTWNVGLDWGLLNNRLTGSFEYFTRYTLDMIGPPLSLPSVYGVTPPKTNNTDMKSYGWEFEISWRDRLKNGLSYGAKFTLSDAQSKITKYPNNPSQYIEGYNYIEGQVMGNIYGYTTIGIAKSDEEMQAHLIQLDANYTAYHGHAPSTPKSGQGAFGSYWGAGDIMYADLNGDGVVNGGDGTLDSMGDKKKIGNSTPRFLFGIDLNAEWKGFDVRAFFQGVMKRDFWQGSLYFWGANTDMPWSTAMVQHMDFYRDENSYIVQQGVMDVNKDAYYPRPSFDYVGVKHQGNVGRNHQIQTRYLQNASYIRLKNLQVGYTLPVELTGKIGVQKLRIYFSGENLWTGTKLAKMFDPETVGGGNWNEEIDLRARNTGNAYPLSTSYSFGLSATF